MLLPFSKIFGTGRPARARTARWAQIQFSRLTKTSPPAMNICYEHISQTRARTARRAAQTHRPRRRDPRPPPSPRHDLGRFRRGRPPPRAGPRGVASPGVAAASYARSYGCDDGARWTWVRTRGPVRTEACRARAAHACAPPGAVAGRAPPSRRRPARIRHRQADSGRAAAL